MTYNDVTVPDELWLLSQVLLNVTMWVGIHASDPFGEPDGRVVTATVTAYAAYMTWVLGLLIIGVMMRGKVRYLYVSFARWFSRVPAVPVSNPNHPTTRLPCPPSTNAADAWAESNSGARAQQ